MKINKKIKNIYNLTKIFSQNSFQNLEIFDKKTNKLNKKSMYVWLIAILMITITYISYEVMKDLSKLANPSIFLNVFFLIVMILNLFQVILVAINVFFFSKDIELVLPLPIKAEELLISKFITMFIRMFLTELIFALIPLIIYGIYTNANLLFYLYTIITLFLFPIFPALIVSIIMMFLMKFSKLIKNKEIFQIIITLIFLIGIFFVEYKLVSAINSQSFQEDLNIETEEQVFELIENYNNNIRNSNKYFLEINWSVDALIYSNIFNSFIEIIKIIFLDIILFILFILSGRKKYLKNLLKNNNYFKYNKKININYSKKCRKRNKLIAYIIKEFKSLLKNAAFFMKCVFPQFNLIITILIIFFIGKNYIQDLSEEMQLTFNFNIFIIILSGFQVINNMSNISATAISREGHSAKYMKFLPIDFYKQFICKISPQVLINLLTIILLIFLIKFIFINISLIYLIYIFIIACLLNVINSEIMGLLDLMKPNLNWKTEYDVIKQDNNKLFQYVLTIIIILILTYSKKVFEGLSFDMSCYLLILVLSIFILLLNIIIKKNIKELFKKIK